MHRSALGLALAAVMIVGCDAAPDSALAPSLDKATLAPSLAKDDRVPNQEHARGEVSRTVSNPCPPIPELVQVTGWLDFHSHFKHFEGGNDSRHHIMTHASGIGLTTGVRYTFHEELRQHAEYTRATDTFQGELVTRWRVISQTGLGNFFATTHDRFVCEGSVCRREIISVETDCRG